MFAMFLQLREPGGAYGWRVMEKNQQYRDPTQAVEVRYATASLVVGEGWGGRGDRSATLIYSLHGIKHISLYSVVGAGRPAEDMEIFVAVIKLSAAWPNCHG